MSIKAVLFDLDGTLADTALDLGGALNRLLQRHGLPTQAMTAIRPIASHGANGLIQLGAGIDKEHPHHAQWRAEYLAEYECGFADETVLFDDINPMLAELDRRNIIWGIITNKPHTFTHRLVPQLGFISTPAVVVSGDTTPEPKPSIKPMLYACQCIAIPPEQCLYVGDAERDMQAGKNAGMRTVLANWGYIADSDNTASWPADACIDTPMDLLKLIEHNSQA